MNTSELGLDKIVDALNIATIERHIFLCADQSKPKCCDKQLGLDAFDFLKRRVKELKLETTVYRSKVNCLRVCEKGPIAVVYPEGVWYHSCTETVLEEIIQQHLIHGSIVEKYVFAKSKALK